MTSQLAFSPLITDLPLAYRFRPTAQPPKDLVILMHGVGSNEDSLLGLASYIPENYAVALVRSPIAIGPGAYCAFSVSFLRDGPKIDADAAEESRQKLLQFIPALQQRCGIAADRTLLGGFSQGGIMSASVALTAPANLRGFAILSGRILPEITPLIARKEELEHLSALIVHGEDDDRLPYFWGEKSIALLGELGVPFELARYKMGHEITREVAADFAEWIRKTLP